MASKFDEVVTSFSGTDMIVHMVFPNNPPIAIGQASTVNYSIFRQMGNVRTVGRITAKGHTRGGRTVAGTIVFTVIHESVIQDIKKRIWVDGKSGKLLKEVYPKIKPDELPPFDLVLNYANELGQSAMLVIYGCSFVDESTTISIEDIYTENVMTFMARDITHLTADAVQYEIGRTFSERPFTEPLSNFSLSSYTRYRRNIEKISDIQLKDEENNSAEYEAQKKKEELEKNKKLQEQINQSLKAGEKPTIINKEVVNATIPNQTSKQGSSQKSSNKSNWKIKITHKSASGGFITNEVDKINVTIYSKTTRKKIRNTITINKNGELNIDYNCGAMEQITIVSTGKGGKLKSSAFRNKVIAREGNTRSNISILVNTTSTKTPTTKTGTQGKPSKPANSGVNNYLHLIKKYSSETGIPISIIAALIDKESSFKIDNVSGRNFDGSKDYGLTQINSRSVNEWGFEKFNNNIKFTTGQLLKDADLAIRVGVRYLKDCYSNAKRRIPTGDLAWKVAFCAYNGGWTAVQKKLDKYGNNLNGYNQISNRQYGEDLYSRINTYKYLDKN